MTASDLDRIAIGSLVWSNKQRTTEGVATIGGCVVDVGLHLDTGEPYVDVLDEGVARVKVQVKADGAKEWKSVRPAAVRRIDLADIDPTTIMEPSVVRMQGWARKALLGEAVLPGHTFALVVVAGTLLQAANALTEVEREARQSRVDDFNAELEERREARRAAS
jgi:hypothetical protein